MSRDYESTPTILGYSEGDVGVIAGGGVFGYGGVMLHEPTDRDFSRIISDLSFVSLPEDSTFGFGLNYDNVATITVSGLLKWTNSFLDRAPEGRQDIRETGKVRIEIFDDEEARQIIENRAGHLERLGINIVY